MVSVSENLVSDKSLGIGFGQNFGIVIQCGRQIMKTLEFGDEVTQNCVKNKACGMKVKFDSTSFIKRPF